MPSRSLGSQAHDLLRTIEVAVTSMRDHVKTLTQASLGDFERSLDRLLKEYDLLLTEIEPPPGNPVTANHEPLLRSMVSFATLIELLLETLEQPLGNAWGRHVFADNHFRYVEFDKLPPRLPDEAVKMMFPEMGADLVSAVLEVQKIGGVTRVGTSIVHILNETADALGYARPTAHALGLSLENADWVSKQLRAPLLRITEMTSNRELVSVLTWTGEHRYPDFQFESTGDLRRSVRHVCENSPRDFTGWALAIWLAKYVDRNDSFFEKKLENIGLWLPSHNRPFAGIFDHLEQSARDRSSLHEVSDVLYRICDRRYSPFYFSSAHPANPSVSGRFDLPASTGHGSLYAGATELGAWSEVLDRIPVVTLRDLFERRLWKLTPDIPLELWDLSKEPPVLRTTPDRAETQDVARMGFEHGYKGLWVGLRSDGTEHGQGAVFFGESGPTLPHAAGIGLWHAEPSAGIEDPSLWRYLKERKDHGAFPVVLRRFPSEIRMR